MAEVAPAAQKTVRVKTTLPSRPLPSNAERLHIRTERLIIRPFVQSDLESYHALRGQPEVMLFSFKGRPDKDLAETQEALDRFLPPRDRDAHNYAVLLAATGELIGGGGYKPGLFMGWPEMGYMFKYEHWKQGYATEFMRAFLEAWWNLPRQEDVETEADPRSVSLFLENRTSAACNEGDIARVPEQLTALVDWENTGSRRLLEKCGFRQVAEWTEPDCREGFNGVDVRLVAYAVSKPN
ncbi:hypothetical protein MGN70_006244 [Eutypa lata]|nr:hypothetical protein MGN70_006244 [Eutypa lata]